MSDVPDRVDCLRFPSDGPDEVRLVPAGVGQRVVAAHREEARRRRRRARVLAGVVVAVTAVAGFLLQGVSVATVAGVLAVAVVVAVAVRRGVAAPAVASPELVDADLAAAAARERYEVATASTAPFGGAGRPAGDEGPG